MATSNTIDKGQIFSRALLFTVCRAAVLSAVKNVTNKTDRIIYNSLEKAIAKHDADKQED